MGSEVLAEVVAILELLHEIAQLENLPRLGSLVFESVGDLHGEIVGLLVRFVVH
jgi:hypothetical protein